MANSIAWRANRRAKDSNENWNMTNFQWASYYWYDDGWNDIITMCDNCYSIAIIIDHYCDGLFWRKQIWKPWTLLLMKWPMTQYWKVTVWTRKRRSDMTTKEWPDQEKADVDLKADDDDHWPDEEKPDVTDNQYTTVKTFWVNWLKEKRWLKASIVQPELYDPARPYYWMTNWRNDPEWPNSIYWYYYWRWPWTTDVDGDDIGKLLMTMVTENGNPSLCWRNWLKALWNDRRISTMAI